MPLAPMTSAPRVLTIPLAASGIAPVLARTSPFEPGQSVLASSAGAAQIFGSSHPGKNDPARYLKFQVAAADVSVAASTLAQVAAARDAQGNVTGDLTITLGTAGGRLAIGILPVMTTAISADDLLNCIILVNGVPYKRITDANSPNPGVGEFGLDADTDAGYTLLIGASTGTDAIPVGTEIEIIKPDTTYTAQIAKGDNSAGAALVAGVLVERKVGVSATVVDTAGRSGSRLVQSDFLAADVAAAALTGLSK